MARRNRSLHWLLFLVAAGVFATLRALSTDVGAVDRPMGGQPPGPGTARTEGTYHRGDPVELAQLLSRIEVVDQRPSIAGFDRGCGSGHGCSFGQPWSDDVDVEFGHNGCDTRNDLLGASLEAVEVRAGTRDCVVLSGVLADPYTGQTIHFLKAEAHAVQVDHLYPLARAWDLGASNWSPEQRKNFANDPRNLLVADGPANASKGDQGPGEWLPRNAGFRCTYVARYLQVADIYDLPITQADADAASLLAPLCKDRSPIPLNHGGTVR